MLGALEQRQDIAWGNGTLCKKGHLSWVLTGEEELSHCFGFLCAAASVAWLGRGVPRSSPSESTAPSCSGFNLLADRDLQAWRGRLVAPPSGSMRQPLSFLHTSPL